MSTDDIADTMLREIWNERLNRGDFVLRMRPAMRHIVQTTASRMRMSMLDEASAAYLARPVDPGALEDFRQSISEALDRRAEHLALPERDVNQRTSDTQKMSDDVPAPQDGHAGSDTRTSTAGPAEREGDHSGGETQEPPVAPAPQADQGRADPQNGFVGRRNGGGQVMPEAREARAAPVTPQSLRNEVLPGWRSLVNEPLFVPETDGLTYGSATREHWTRRLQWHHDQAKGHLDTARKERLILQELEASDAGCLNDLLDGRAS